MHGNGKNRGISLAEVAIAVGILFLIAAASAPLYLRYRGKTNVNRAAEVTRALIERAGEEAKSSGYPLPEDLVRDGLAAAATPPAPESELVVRLRKKVGENITLIAERPLPGSDGFETSLTGFGSVELESLQAQGTFLEFLNTSGGSETLLATMPVDVNGEFILAADQANAFIQFSYGQHVRLIEVTNRGVVRADQR